MPTPSSTPTSIGTPGPSIPPTTPGVTSSSINGALQTEVATSGAVRTVDPTTPETARDEQTLVPETARD
jgi:hypothetical protein